MRYGFAIIIFLGCFALHKPIAAQQQIFKNYSVNDGLVSNSVRRICQDSKGFLWIATWEGLSKYDGHAFTSFSTANGLSHNLVNAVYGPANGPLYVALNDGSIDAITDNNITRIGKSFVINQFLTTAGHPVIIATDGNGLQVFENGNSRKPNQSLPSETFTDMVWLNDSLIMVASDSSIHLFTQSFKRFATSEKRASWFVDAQVYKDSRQRIWVGTHTGLMMVNGLPARNGLLSVAAAPAPFNSPLLTGKKINAILEDTDGNIWIGTNGGLVKTDNQGRQQLITVKDGLASNIVTCIYQDNQQTLWFGTAVGLSKLITRSSIFLYPIDGGVVTSDNTYLLYPVNKKDLLISTSAGTQIFNKTSGAFRPVSTKEALPAFNAVQYMPSPLLISANGLTTFDTTTLKCGARTPLPLTNAIRIVMDKYGHSFSSNLTQLTYNIDGNRQTILTRRISAMLIEKNGNLWAGTWLDGLYCLRYQCTNNTLQVQQLTHYLPNENIRSLYEDTQGNIWAGTRYNGVHRLTKNADNSFSITTYNQNQGLGSNFIKAIRQDKKGNVWIASYQSLDKLIPRGNGFQIFNFSRINNYFASIIGLETDNENSLWLATGEGLTYIKDGELEKLPPVPVYITKVYSPDSVYSATGNTIQLNYLQNQLQFEFSSPGFINEKQILYSYRLSHNSDTQWTAGSNQHIVSYASLQPGNYVFQVRSLGWNNEWSKPAAIAFAISQPFWQRWWFILLCIAIMALSTYMIIKKSIKQIQHEAAMKQRISETEMMALRAQMNPHFIFNCLNSIDNLIQMEEKEKATSYLSKFAKLIRSILETSKNNVVPCWKDMGTLKLYLELEALRFDNKFSYQINMSDEILHGDYKVPPLVIQPFVENAIHHGLLNKISNDKKLSVVVSVSANKLCYIIEDNGVGRQQSAVYKQLNKPAYESLGMQITADRINLFNQQNNGAVKITDLYDNTGNAVGTRVEIALTIQP